MSANSACIFLLYAAVSVPEEVVAGSWSLVSQSSVNTYPVFVLQKYLPILHRGDRQTDHTFIACTVFHLRLFLLIPAAAAAAAASIYLFYCCTGHHKWRINLFCQ